MVGYLYVIVAFSALILPRGPNQASAACTPPNCNGNGICNSQTQMCDCSDPFTGESCDKRDWCKILNEKGEWKDLDCGKHGKCKPHPSSNPTCDCDKGYQGMWCELVDLCVWDMDLTPWPTGNPCQHNATCKSFWKGYVDKQAISHQLGCYCGPDRKGIFCEYENPCYYNGTGMHPCYSRGTCSIRYKKHDPKNWEPIKACKCDFGYYPETYCEKKDPCIATGGRGSVCKNGARCVVEKSGNDLVAKCICRKNYDGDYCERVNKCGIPASECQKERNPHDCNPCMNGGKCISTLTPVSALKKPIPGYKDKFYRAHTCNCSQTYYSGEFCDILKTGVFVVPANYNGTTASTNIASFEAISGYTQEYYIVATVFGQESEILVETGDGFHFPLSIQAMRPIPEDNIVLSTFGGLQGNKSKQGIVYYPFRYTYTEGNYLMKVSVSNGGMLTDEKKIDVKVVLPDGAKCVPSTRLKNVGHTIMGAVEYKRSDVFVVEASFMLDCFEKEWLKDQLSPTPQIKPKFRFQWRLNKLTHLFPSPSAENDWHVENLVSTSEKYLIFKPYVLLEGTYWVEGRLFVDINGTEYGNSDRGFIQMNPSPPKIVLMGGNDRTVDGGSEIILDASKSVDESFHEHTPYLNYTWECSDPCKMGPWTDSIVRIPSGTFSNGETVSISLRVKSLHSKTQASTTITLRIQQRVSLSIECIRNCKWFNPGDEVIFECNYNLDGKPGNAEGLNWTWLPAEEVFPSAVKNEPHMMSIVLPEITQNLIMARSIKCSVTPPETGQEIFAKSDFEINTPPMGGVCSITPSAGIFLETKFTVDCNSFTDSGLPLVYTFFAEVVRKKDTMMMGNLYSRMSLGHDTNSYLDDVYLPFGDASNFDSINVVVRVTDNLGLSREIKIPVVVSISPASDFKQLYMDFIIANNSTMINRFLRGDYQGTLQVQMLALYGLLYDEIRSELTKDEFSSALDAIQQLIIKTPQHSFKANQQLIFTTHLMDHVDDRLLDSNVLLTVTRAMHEASSHLVRFAKNANEVTSAAELETLANSISNSGSRLLRTSVACSKTLNQDQGMMMTCNERNVLDFDSKDRQNPDAYFEVIEDDLSTSEKQSAGTISTSSDKHTQDCSKSGRNALRAIRGALDGAIGHLGPALTYNVETTEISARAQIMSHVNSSVNIVLQTDDDSIDTIVNVTIPANTLQILQDRIDTHSAQLEIQTIATADNAYVDDTSACPTTSTLHLKVQDSDLHVPVTLKNLDEPIEVSLPILRPISDAELEIGKSANQQVEILPLDELDDYYNLPTFQMYLPHNSKIIAYIDDQSSDTMNFKMIASVGRKAVFSDFCKEGNAIDVDPLTNTAVFYTDRISLNEEPEEPYIDYHVSILAFDFHNVHRLERFSISFTRYSCLFRDDDRQFWSEQGCMVSNDSTMAITSFAPSPLYLSRLICVCNHASVISGVQFVIPHSIDIPNVIDSFSIYEIQRNPVVLITVCVLLTLYLVGMILCWCFDRRDAKQDVVLTIMADLNTKSETSTLYLITVCSGCNFWAGTTSSVSLIIYGSAGRSQVYTLKDRSNPLVLLRGRVDSFLVSAEKDLGTLEKIRIWSDYTGMDPAWYCRKVMIRKIKLDQVWHFYLNRWLTVTPEEASVSLEIPATTKELRKVFSVRYKENLLEQVDNFNLWFSIFRYSPVGNFTRCQRLSCAFAVLTVYLLIDIWFHGTPTEDADGIFVIGDHPFNWYALVKSLEVILLAVPPGIILIALFRYIHSRYTPTLIVWENFVPTKADLEKENLFIPGLEKQKSKSKKRKSVQIQEPGAKDKVFEFSLDSDSESYPTTSSAVSTFSIPSTDIPKLESWIKDRAKSGMESDVGTSESDDDFSPAARIKNITSARDDDPDMFIFQGENDVEHVENLIDEQLKANKAKRNAKEPNDKQGIIGGGGDDEIFKEMENKSDGEKLGEEETQKKGYWGSQLALEMCRLSVDFSQSSCLSWPWWVIFIAWTVCLLTMFACLFLTLLYGLHYGYLRSMLWLETLIYSCVLSILIVHPLQALLLAYLATLLGRRQKVKERLQVLVEDVSSKAKYLKSRLPYRFNLFRPLEMNWPLSGNQIFRLTMEARRKKELHGKLIRLILCVLPLIPLIVVAYSRHGPDNYRLTYNIRKMFELDELGSEKAKFSSKAEVFNYFEDVVLNTLHPSKYYNNERIPPNSPTLLSDQQTLLIGVGRIRQQRVKSAECSPPVGLDDNFARPTGKMCNKDLKRPTEDRDNYNPVWDSVLAHNSKLPRTPSSLTNDGWEYNPHGSERTQSLTRKGLRGKYDGGGYILNLGRTRAQTLSVLKYMQKTSWLDHRSRAIFFEVTLMNPNINKFMDVILLMEQDPTGSFSMTSFVSPIELIPIEDLMHQDQVLWVSISLIAIVILLLIWTCIFIKGVIESKREGRYIQTGFWLELTIIVLVITCLAISLVRFLAAEQFADLLIRTKEDEYLSIQSAAYWTDVQRAMFAITQAVVFIKFWTLLMFTDKRFLTFALTLKLTYNYILGFVFSLIILLCAFSSFGFFVFGQHLWEYSTWGESMVSLIDQIIGISLLNNFKSIDHFLGPVFSFLFGFCVMFVSLNFVIALLDLGVHEAKEVVRQRRVWLTYSRYFKELLLRSLVFVNAVKKQEDKHNSSKVVHPERWNGMKMATASYIRSFLVEAKVEKMREMERHLNSTLLAGTGYRMRNKKEKVYEKEREKQRHIDQLRKITSIYIQERLGHQKKSKKEFKEFTDADFNKTLVKLRIEKLEKMVDRLGEKIDAIQL